MIDIAFSSCPNDIFLFRSFLQDKAYDSCLHIADVSQLNTWALERKYPLMKISAALFPKVSNHYRLMATGAILGDKVGPLILKSKDNSQPIRRIATPGDTTTAHILCRTFCPQAQLIPMVYHEVIPSILHGNVCAGVVIHEERFTYPSSLSVAHHLGDLWHAKEQLPLPLGCLVIDKNIHKDLVLSLTQKIRQSLCSALQNMSDSLQLAARYAKNKDIQVIRRFIDTYVNDETSVLSRTGLQALQTLWTYEST